jgi:FkbM family methyltransferase
MINYENFDWGSTTQEYRTQMIREFFSTEKNIYERFFEVEENDIVVDIGATIGEFVFSVLNKKPKHCYVVEPLAIFFDTLRKNLEGNPVCFINKAISSEKYLEILWDTREEVIEPLTFSELIKQNRLNKIDFLKVDCEGGEYNVFSKRNIDFLKSIPKIVVEFHLSDKILKEQFRFFRDNVLKNFPKFEVYSLDDVNIKWDLNNEHFIQYYREVMFYFDNRIKG